MEKPLRDQVDAGNAGRGSSYPSDSSFTLKVILAILAYTAVYSFFCIMRHLSAAYGDPDLGIFNQAFYTTAYCGKMFFNTFEAGNHFRMHISPIFFLLLPFYYIFPDTSTLLVLQTAAIASAAWPLYLIARCRISAQAGFFFVLIYLLNHPLHGVNYDQFHELGFVIPALFWSYYFLLERRFLPFWICVIIALACKETVSVLIASYGIYLVYLSMARKPPAFEKPHAGKKMLCSGVALFFLGALYLPLCVNILIPYFRGGEPYGFFAERYGHLGNTLQEVLLSLITHPVYAFSQVLTWPRISYLLEILFPLAFLPLRSLALFAVSLPSLSYILLSRDLLICNVGSRYTAEVLPFMFLASVEGLASILKRFDNGKIGTRAFSRIIRYPVIFTVLFMLFFDLTPMRIGWNHPRITDHERIVWEMVRLIPRDASVSTQPGIYQLLCNRVACFARYQEGVEYILVDSRNVGYKYGGWEDAFPKVLSDRVYEKIAERDGVILLRKKENRRE